VTTLLGVGTETPGDCTDDTLPGDPVIDMSSRSDTKLRGDIGCWLLRRGRLKHVSVNVSHSRLKLSVTVEWIISGHFLIYTLVERTHTHGYITVIIFIFYGANSNNILMLYKTNNLNIQHSKYINNKYNKTKKSDIIVIKTIKSFKYLHCNK